MVNKKKCKLCLIKKYKEYLNLKLIKNYKNQESV